MALVLGPGPNTAATYRTVHESFSRFSAPTANTYVLPAQGDSLQVANGVAYAAMFYFDPADYAVAGKTTKCRLKVVGGTNATAPAVNFTTGLYPVASMSGGAASVGVVLGTVTSGSTVAINSPTLGVTFAADSGQFTAPAAGAFALAVVVSGAAAASSAVGIVARLEVVNI